MRSLASGERSALWWRALLGLAVLWWLGATVGDALLDRWWLADAASSTSSTWAGAVDFAAAHARLEAFRWGGSIAGALLCGGWAWRQGHLAVANARESEASLGALWSVDEAGTPVLSAVSGHPTGRWIPLEDKLALDRFRPIALRLCVAGAALVGANLGGRTWPLWLDFWAARPLGPRDPWLGADLSFYLFRLPALDFAWRLMLLAQWMALALALVIYLYEDALQVGRRLWASKRALRHLALMLALLLGWKALGALLYPFELLVQRSPGWSGPHALDWSWRVPLNFACALATLLCAGWCLREAREQRPAGVLKWSLAPVALSWLAVSALPSIRQATVAPAKAARADAPFAQAQLPWTRLALGLPGTSPLAPVSPEPEASHPQAARALEAALGTREVAAWAEWKDADGDSLAGEATATLSLAPGAPSTPGPAGTGGGVEVAWQQAGPVRFAPGTWEQRHLDSSPSLTWKRFSIEPSQAAPSDWLRQRDERTFKVLCAHDAAASPGLLSDGEVARAIASGTTQEGAGRAARLFVRPGSIFRGPFDAAGSARGTRRLPAFRVLGTSDREESGVGAPLDAGWKRWLAAWRLGSLALGLSPRVGDGARLVWRLDATERCRRLAPFLSWPGAPRPLVDQRGELFYLLDGYTLSAAFPLARPLHSSGAFTLSRLARRTDRTDRRASSAARKAAGGEEGAEGKEDSQELIERMLQREEVLARVAAGFDGYNWARASVAALVEARTGAVRLFPLDDADPILSLFRRALPEMWSPATSLPAFARPALRTPPHLAALQSSAWAALEQPAPDRSWRAFRVFFVPHPKGLRTGSLLTASSPGAPSAPSETLAATTLAPAGPQVPEAPWQARFLRPPAQWSRATAALPLDASADAARWLVRLPNEVPSSTSRAPSAPAPPSSTWEARWKSAREMLRHQQQARARGDWKLYDEASRELGRLLELDTPSALESATRRKATR